MNEAAMAHYYGLKPALALASVTSTPADALGLGHRVGTIREGAYYLFLLYHRPSDSYSTGFDAGEQCRVNFDQAPHVTGRHGRLGFSSSLSRSDSKAGLYRRNPSAGGSPSVT